MKRYLNKNHIIILLCVFIGLVVVEKATKPLPLSYEEAIVEVVETDKSLEIDFSDIVTNYIVTEDEGRSESNVLAYRSLYSGLFNVKHDKSASLEIKDEDTRIYYEEANVIGEDRLLYGKPISGVRKTMPRVVLSYYFLISVVIFVISIALRSLITKPSVKQVVNSLVALSGSYVMTNFLMKGFSSTTYFINRDLFYIVIGTIIMSIILLYVLDDERY